MIPNLAPWQWLLGAFSALAIGVAKTGLPGLGSFVAPLMVLTVGDARYAAAWTLPILSTADVFAVLFWHKHAEARKLFSLIPWVAAGMLAGAIALGLSEHTLRRVIGCVVVLMLVVHIVRRRNPQQQVAGSPSFYGIGRFCEYYRQRGWTCHEHVPAQPQAAKRTVRRDRRVVFPCDQPGESSDIFVASPIQQHVLELRLADGPCRCMQRLCGAMDCSQSAAAVVRYDDCLADGDLSVRSVPIGQP
jgi:hypothetical protein